MLAHVCRPLAQTALRQVHNTVSGPLSAPVRREWIKSNPAAVGRKPRQPHPDPDPPSPDEAARAPLQLPRSTTRIGALSSSRRCLSRSAAECRRSPASTRPPAGTPSAPVVLRARLAREIAALLPASFSPGQIVSLNSVMLPFVVVTGSRSPDHRRLSRLHERHARAVAAWAGEDRGGA